MAAKRPQTWQLWLHLITASAGFAAAARQIASKLRSYALWAESKTIGAALGI
jgi:hypothetical protein